MKTTFYITCLLLIFITSSSFAQKNLIYNGGFENDLDAWVNYGGAVTPYDHKEGKNSCVIIAPNTEKWLGLHQIIHIPKKAVILEISAWLKTINVIKGLVDWNGAVLNIEFLDNREQKIGESITIANLTGDQEWQLVQKTINIPAGAANVKVLAAMANASGTLFIDEVSAKTRLSP